MVKSFIKYFFLTVILFSLFFLGSFKIGPLTMRNYMTIVLFVTAFLMPKQEELKDEVVTMYGVYIAMLILCCMINGTLTSIRLIRIILAFIFPSVVVLYSLPKLISSRLDLYVTILIITILYLLNAGVTYGQYLGNSFCWQISDMIGFQIPEEAEAFALGSFLPGLTGDVVNNGYFLGCLVPIITFALFLKNRYCKLVGYALLFFSAIVTFYVQQRMAFICVALYVIFLAFINKDKVLRGFIFLMAIGILFYGIDFSNFDLGRMTVETDNSSRTRLFDVFLNFTESEYIIFGNYEEYLKHFGGIQHNSFTGVTTLGGIPLFLVFFLLSYKMVLRLYQVLKDNYNKSPLISCFAISCFLYVGYEQTHSAGIHNEGLLFWTSYSLLLIFERLMHRI